ncbi:MAG: DNA cytosine methyltransferase, partial [Desulfurellales bacterium]
WLRNLIAANLIPDGEVDERSIVDVAPDDLRQFRQCHFFAGLGGWALAARLVGWPASRELWTGSPPCQPFSVAGQGKAQADDRHLWPHLFRLASARRPAVLMGEQVAAAVGKDWLDGVFADLEGIGYACGAAVVPACAVDAPHRRDRLWFVAHANEPYAGAQRAERSGQLGGAGRDSGACACVAGYADGQRREELRGTEPVRAEQPGLERAGGRAESGSGRGGADGERIGVRGKGCAATGAATAGVQRAHKEWQRVRIDAWAARMPGSAWHGADWIIGHDGKARRVEPGIRLLAHGVPARVGRLRAYGNAIIPEVAAEVIGAFMDVRP